MNTKDKIIEEALSLFSVLGFKGTSVKNIAQAVGIKDSSIYKHYKSKREILDAIVCQMKKRMGEMSMTLGMPENGDDEFVAATYGKMTLDELQKLSRKIFLFYLQDPLVSRFWRLALMEQFQNREIYEIYRTIFLQQSMEYQTMLFSKMIRQGTFRPGDPEVLAMNYYGSIYFLLSKYNGRTEEVEEALGILDKQIAEFYRIYKIN